MADSPSRGKRDTLSWVAWFVFANGLLAMLVGLRYAQWIDIGDPATAAYVAVLYPGQFAMLAWLFGLPLLLAALILPARLTRILAVAAAAAGIGILAVDTVVYALYRFHLSGFVLELALGAGGQAFSLAATTQLVAAAVGAAILLLELTLAGLFLRRRPRGRWLGAAFATLLLSQLGAHGWHAWADANYDSRITSVTRHIPLYYAATAKRFMQSQGLVDPQKVRENQSAEKLVSARGGRLNYPVAPMQCTAPAKPKNLLVIVADSVRWDLLTERNMPAVSELKASSQVFERHFSNGNATKPGLFTLFYGIPASYWDAFTAAQQPPVLIEQMQSGGYDTQVLASATLVSPAFDRNIFSSIEDLRLETPGDKPWQRDARITRDWLDFTAAREARNDEAPFFGFLFYDTTHSYLVPEDYPKFEPHWNVNRLALDNEFDPEPFLNAYRTAGHYVDNQIRRVLDDLRVRGLMDDTIVVFTSDHGEEFNEHGMNYWGHGSNFGDYQLRVPLVIHWPGMAPKTYRHRTQHFDVAPALIRKGLGCVATPPKQFSSDYGLFNEGRLGWNMSHSYMDYALLMPEFHLVKHASGTVDLLDTATLKPARNVRIPGGVMREVLREMSRFYQSEEE
ncbi:DUF3413 domain-containing protein [Microbulbifer halophilus]|uniref:DUF3413 domain-containing protein n=1 Tax=Microbulbifer halophilus TaxID=453963 RepID=A0ABW5EGZ8_9GAMM|nr:DUF3413 domain-containing protein [Microbulbifer halophilus]MCW8127330.1 DUF3413 domain-containing protein [Microbulbifer halophilus]